MLTGDTREHALLFVYGPGGNGKNVWLDTVSGILHDYAKTAAMETFTASIGDRHPTDLAMLRGARMVCASETEEGRAWAESRIKALTGGDKISARFMRQDFFEFSPQFKLVIIGNHKPTLRNVDEAARRRFNIAPFTYKPATPDKELKDKLRKEWPGILRWMIEGCLRWQREGLIRPKVVTDATEEYFSEQDSVRQWIEECCEIGERIYSVTSAELYKSWTGYAVGIGEKPGTRKWFSQSLMRLGYQRTHDRRSRGFSGIRVKIQASFHEPEADRAWP
jgi:putative DNA primase/helicase